jgi:hypothetical protein
MVEKQLKKNLTTKYYSSILFVLIFMKLASAQSYDQPPASEIDTSQFNSLVHLNFLSDCNEAATIAEDNLKEHKAFLLLKSGITATVYTTDKQFEEKFSIRYYDFGCIGPDEACILKYNWQVFDFLTKRYGKSWLKTVRKDVKGLALWKKMKT